MFGSNFSMGDIIDFQVESSPEYKALRKASKMCKEAQPLLEGSLTVLQAEAMSGKTDMTQYQRFVSEISDLLLSGISDFRKVHQQVKQPAQEEEDHNV